MAGVSRLPSRTCLRFTITKACSGWGQRIKNIDLVDLSARCSPQFRDLLQIMSARILPMTQPMALLCLTQIVLVDQFLESKVSNCGVGVDLIVERFRYIQQELGAGGFRQPSLIAPDEMHIHHQSAEG